MTTTYPRHRSRPTGPAPHARVDGGTSPRTGRRVALAAAVVAALAGVAVGSLAVARYVTADSRHDFLRPDGWPAHGQAAYATDAVAGRADGPQAAVPIASLAKVMTAYLVVTDLPLRPGQDGPTLTVTAHDVADTARRRAEEQSVVPLRVGEVLSERQALMALLLPSANNVAAMLSRLDGRSPAAFVARMNDMAHSLRMRHTHYTDPSGFDEHTVSTASDQLILARRAGANPTLALMMATREYPLPYGPTVRNTDSVLGQHGILGMKTGSDDAAGGCFMFHARQRVGGRVVDVWGVVLGQHGRHLITAGLYAGVQLADRAVSADPPPAWH
jgi:D-alanyl-D-alanine carboxypeptidase (penicillin-binding protein 5/6)